MTTDEIENQVRSISEVLQAISEKTPDMTGQDWAYDHGWITNKEYKAHEEQASKMYSLAQLELKKVEKLRSENEEIFRRWFNSLLNHLENLMISLEKKYKLKANEASKEKKVRDARFDYLLMKSILPCLDSWYNNEAPKHEPAWAFRVLFNAIDRAEAKLHEE